MDKVNQSLLTLLTRLGVGYLDDTLYRLTWSGDKVSWQQDTSFRPKVLILGRQHYQESVRSFPLDSHSEVRKLLKLEYGEQTNVSWRLWPAADGHTQVNLWQWQVSAPALQFLPAIASARLMLPISALLAEQMAPMSVLQAHLPAFGQQGRADDKPGLFVARKPAGIVSARQGGLMQSVMHFQMSSGLNSGTDPIYYSGEQTLLAVMAALPGFVLRYTAMFWHQPASAAFAWQPLLLGGGLLFAAYLALSSAYLGVKSVMLESAIAEQRAEVNQALDVQNRYNQLATTLAQGQAFTAEQALTSQVWTLIIPLMDEVRFSRIQYRNQRFIMRGETDKASDILSRVLALPQVAEAKFDAQVQRSRSKETFVISFTLKEADNGNA